MADISIVEDWNEHPRVLVADDDPDFRTAFVKMLERHGCRVQSATNAMEAMQALRLQSFDVLISDIFMPGNANLELLAQVPQISAGLPVILLTGRPTLDTAMKSISFSVAGYLTKPPDMKELLTLVRRATVGHRCMRDMTQRRKHFEKMADELFRLESTLQRIGDPNSLNTALRWLQMSLHNVIHQLNDMDDCLQLLDTLRGKDRALEDVVRHAIEVLQEGRTNFQNQRLGVLRQELESALGKLPVEPAAAPATHATPPATPPA
jgi:CheY-like chemotaxis protein